MITTKIVNVVGLSKAFNGRKALDTVDFSIDQGEIFGFLGPSGSGKTTTINILTKQLQADSGKVTVFGKESHTMATTDLEKIGIMSDSSGYFEKLSLMKNLEFYGRLYGKKRRDIDYLLKEVGLYESRNKPAEKLSTGMKQRMLLARALINQPKLLFLDEPTSGLDPMTSRRIHRLLQQLKEQGTTIFLTTHDMEEATKLCDRLVLLHEGQIVETGSPTAIIQKYNEKLLVDVSYGNQNVERIPIENLPLILKNKIATIHSCEPTLEDIFIKLTGEKLHDEEN